ncbi:MAG: branched-chain amino acid ABC transporter substrate-binding protein, partial [Ktedonobacteraceae bacterium]
MSIRRNIQYARILVLVMGTALLLGVLAACDTSGGAKGTTTPPGVTIKIAADLPVTGLAASSGKPIENGARLAIDEANADKNFLPGYTFAFVPLDDAGAAGYADPSVGAVNVTSLIEDAEVAGIIGPFNSAAAQSELPLSNPAPLAQLGPSSTSVCLTQNTPDTGCVGQDDVLSQVRPTARVTYFRIAATDNHQGEVGADYAFKTLKDTSAFVVDDTTLYGSDIAQAFVSKFKADGGDVLDQDSIAATTDYTQELRKIAARRPDIIYFAGLDATGGILMRKQMASTPGLERTPFMG